MLSIRKVVCQDPKYTCQWRQKRFCTLQVIFQQAIVCATIGGMFKLILTSLKDFIYWILFWHDQLLANQSSENKADIYIYRTMPIFKYLLCISSGSIEAKIFLPRYLFLAERILNFIINLLSSTNHSTYPSNKRFFWPNKVAPPSSNLIHSPLDGPPMRVEQKVRKWLPLDRI